MPRPKKLIKPTKISLDLEDEAYSIMLELKKAYSLKSNGEVISLVLETFYNAYLKKLTTNDQR